MLNNGAHDSVGGQPTVGREIDFCKIAEGCGYENVLKAATLDELDAAIASAKESKKLSFIEVLVKKGARKDLGRPKSSPIENKQELMKFLGSR